jgi:cytochrome c-type biogenesis protein CcmH/NrfF
MSALRRAAGPVALCCLLIVALVVGSGALDANRTSAAPRLATRIAALERDVKCPGCIDLSVAQSTSATSIAVRNEIIASVHAGQTDSQILATITQRYGTAILLLPPPGGIDTVLWAVPTALAVVAGALLGRALLRRRPPT